MKLYDSFRSALQSLVVNKLRSALTMLGVIIGVASVIAMVAVGNGASQQVQNTILSLGSNLITVAPANLSDQGLRGAGAQAANLTLDDMRAIQAQLGSSIAAIHAEQGAGRWQVTGAGQNCVASPTSGGAVTKVGGNAATYDVNGGLQIS